MEGAEKEEKKNKNFCLQERIVDFFYFLDQRSTLKIPALIYY